MIDQLRFPPNNCTVIKILVRLVDKTFNDLISPAASIPDFESPVTLPVYNFRIELRDKVVFVKTAFLFLIFVTIDEKTETGIPNIAGYSFFPLFLDKETNEPATDESEEILLHDGSYQLPIFCQDYPYALDFDMKKAVALEKVPCFSVLLRVKKPALDSEGDPLSVNTVERSQWEKEVWPPFKSYRENYPYCNKYIQNTQPEDVKFALYFSSYTQPDSKP